jgi:NAD(P)-dependent dehydrogenase (short-subunit alcohol dehydrogenase family)
MRRHSRKRSRILITAAGVGLGIAASRMLLARRGQDLNGRVVLITGGSRGLGFLLAREFAGKGCRVAICARNSEELERARHDLEEGGAEVLAVPCDVTQRVQVDQLIEETLRRYGAIDILVNNAGIIQVGPVDSMTYEDFDEAMAVMFWGVLHLTLAVLPHMRERKSGHIVNITSIGGKVSVPHLVPYNCAKFAAVALSEGLRAELRPQALRVVTIVPGLMRTGSYQNAFFKGRPEKESAWFSLGAALPGISMDAERAARQIVRATERGESERILSWPAKVLARFHGLFPGTTADLLSLINRLILPPPGGEETGRIRGFEAQQRLDSRVVSALTVLGRKAADHFHQRPAPQTV